MKKDKICNVWCKDEITNTSGPKETLHSFKWILNARVSLIKVDLQNQCWTMVKIINFLVFCPEQNQILPREKICPNFGKNYPMAILIDCFKDNNTYIIHNT